MCLRALPLVTSRPVKPSALWQGERLNTNRKQTVCSELSCGVLGWRKEAGHNNPASGFAAGTYESNCMHHRGEAWSQNWKCIWEAVLWYHSLFPEWAFVKSVPEGGFFLWGSAVPELELVWSQKKNKAWRIVILWLHSTTQRLRIWSLEPDSPSSNSSSIVRIWSQNVQIKILALLLRMNPVSLS